MIVKNKQTITEEREVIVDVICNSCGSSCLPRGTDVPHGLIEISYTGGYFSTHVPDCERWTFSLCEKCLHELVSKFKIAPESQDVPF